MTKVIYPIGPFWHGNVHVSKEECQTRFCVITMVMSSSQVPHLPRFVDSCWVLRLAPSLLCRDLDLI